MTKIKKLLIEFDGIIEDKYCSICKLELREKQRVLQCPYCENLFHKEHIEEWLQNNTKCPVCQKKLKGISDQYEKNSIISRTANIDSFLSIVELGVFKNPMFSNKKQLIRNQFLAGFFSILLLAILVCAFVFTIRADALIIALKELLSVVLMFFMLFSILAVIPIFSKRYSFNYKWKSLEFKEECIIIKGEFKENEIKIELSDIQSIELVQSSKRPKQSNVNTLNPDDLLHFIKLIINLRNGKNYFLKSISRLYNLQRHTEIFHALENLFRNIYNIELVTNKGGNES